MVSTPVPLARPILSCFDPKVRYTCTRNVTQRLKKDMVSAIHVSHTGVLYVFDVYDIRNGHWHGGAKIDVNLQD